MMAYQNGFVVSIVSDEKPIREFNENGERIAHLKFGSEYKVRVKNPHNSRATCTITIDGMDVFSGSELILNSHQTLDVERFVVSNDSGQRFKFVELGHSDVQDPTSSENGIVEVTFRREFEPVKPFQKSIFRNATPQAWPAGNVTMDYNAGATVAGSLSTQGFANVPSFRTETQSTTIRILLRGIKETPVTEVTISKNGKATIKNPNGWPNNIQADWFRISERGLEAGFEGGGEFKTESFKVLV